MALPDVLPRAEISLHAHVSRDVTKHSAGGATLLRRHRMLEVPRHLPAQGTSPHSV